jgi:hypothetical protein
VLRTRIAVRNRTDRPLSIERIETECPCVRLDPIPLRLEPGGTMPLVVAFDPTEEPAFRGGLSVGVVGYENDRRAAFRTRVEIEVRREAE